MFLLVQISPRLGFSILPTLTGWQTRWQDSGLGHWLGFYDVIRKSGYGAVGLRFWPFEQAVDLLHFEVSDRLYWTEGQKAVCMLFEANRVWDEIESGDQMMEEARILKRNQTERALFLGLSALSASDQNEIARRVSSCKV